MQLKKYGKNEFTQILLLFLLSLTLKNLYEFFFYAKLTSFTVNPYTNFSIIISAFSSVSLDAIIILTSLPFLIYWKKTKWTTYDPDNLRWLLLVLTLVLALPYSTYEYNFYFNQWHLTDRLLLLSSALLILWHPLFLNLFLIFTYLILSQFAILPGGYPYIDLHLVLSFLFIFLGFFLLNISLDLNYKVFIFCMLCLIGGNYFYTVLKKMALSPSLFEWPLEFKLHMANAWAQFKGWLSWLSPQNRLVIFEVFKYLNRPLVILSFVMELLSIFIIWNFYWTIALFVLFIGFHTIAFILSGMFFWKWIMCYVAFLLFLSFLSIDKRKNIYNKSIYFKSACIVLIIIGPVIGLIHSLPLAWWETSYHLYFVIQGKTADGKTYNISNDVFSKYQKYLSFNARYRYILEKRTLPSNIQSYARSRNINKTLQQTNSISFTENAYGIDHYNYQSKQKLKNFLRRYINNMKSENDYYKDWVAYLNPFKHIHTTKVSNPISRDKIDQLQSIQIILYETTDDNFLKHQRKRTLLSVDLQ